MSAPLVIDAHARQAYAVRFTRDGKRLVSAGQDGKVKLWSVPGFKPESVLEGHEKSVHALSFDAAERKLASASSDPAVRVWSFPEKRLCFTLEKQLHACLGPDGEHLATISAKGELMLFDAAHGTPLCTLPPLDKRHLSLAFAPNGAFLFVGGSGPIHRVSLPDGTSDGVQRGHAIGVAALTISPSGAILASTGFDGTLRFWTVVGGDEVSTVPLGEHGPRAGAAGAALGAHAVAGALQLAFAPDGRSIAVSCDTAVLRLSAPDGDLIERHETGVKGVFGVAFSPDGRRLACAAADGRVRIFEV